MNQTNNNNYQIRNAISQDLNKIANVHKACFKNSFSTQLGKYLLKKFYKTYLDQNPKLFFVVEKSDEIIGFCMGYLCTDKSITNQFIKRNWLFFFFRCLFLMITFNKQFWHKLVSTFKKKKVNELVFDEKFLLIDKKQIADLLSVCVLENFRGQGLSTELIKCFLNSLKKQSIYHCVLSVDPNNLRAIRFYEKTGFVLFKKNQERLVYRITL